MTAAREYGLIRTTADAESIFDDRTIPAGMKGTVLEARSDGSCLAEFAFAPQTADSDGDFVQGILTRDQYEIIETCPSTAGTSRRGFASSGWVTPISGTHPRALAGRSRCV